MKDVFMVIGLGIAVGFTVLCMIGFFTSDPKPGEMWTDTSSPDPFKDNRVRVEDVREGYVKYFIYDSQVTISTTIRGFKALHSRLDEQGEQ